MHACNNYRNDRTTESKEQYNRIRAKELKTIDSNGATESEEKTFGGIFSESKSLKRYCGRYFYACGADEPKMSLDSGRIFQAFSFRIIYIREE